MKIQTSSILLRWPLTIALPTVSVQQILIWPRLAIRLTSTVMVQQQIPVADSQMNIPRKSTVTAQSTIGLGLALGREQLFRKTQV
jgi:hypothetical protein